MEGAAGCSTVEGGEAWYELVAGVITCCKAAGAADAACCDCEVGSGLVATTSPPPTPYNTNPAHPTKSTPTTATEIPPATATRSSFGRSRNLCIVLITMSYGLKTTTSPPFPTMSRSLNVNLSTGC